MLNLEYLKNLNEQQKEAVSYLNGPLLIVAGAGSGKTKVLTSRDRKSTRLNSSHVVISYAVFCLKKKNTHTPSSS